MIKMIKTMRQSVHNLLDLLSYFVLMVSCWSMFLLTRFYLFWPNATMQVISRKERERQVKRRTSPDEDSGSEVPFFWCLDVLTAYISQFCNWYWWWNSFYIHLFDEFCCAVHQIYFFTWVHFSKLWCACSTLLIYVSPKEKKILYWLSLFFLIIPKSSFAKFSFFFCAYRTLLLVCFVKAFLPFLNICQFSWCDYLSIC